jgi:hypothetical protein
VNWATGENTNVLCKVKPRGGHRQSHNEGPRPKKVIHKVKVSKTQGLRKKERHEDTEEGRALLERSVREERCEKGRSVRLMIDSWQAI